MEKTIFSIYSRQDFSMSKTMHLHIQHGRLNIKEASQEDHPPTHSNLYILFLSLSLKFILHLLSSIYHI